MTVLSLRAAWAACRRAARERGPAAAVLLAGAMARHTVGRRMPRLLQRCLGLLPRHREGTLFIGYLDAALGLGESLRGLVVAIAEQSVPFALHAVTGGVEDRSIATAIPGRRDKAGRYDINVVEVAPDQLPHVRREVGEARFTSSYNILRPYWELPNVPSAWVPLLRDFDEIWAPTRFVADAFAAAFDGPVTIVPPCVDVPAPRRTERSRPFRFIFSFDYQSSPIRKNPLAVVRAFQAAFPHSGASVALLVKSTGLPPPHLATEATRELHRTLAATAAADPRIELLEAILTRDAMLDLIAGSGCYVSLHRSEGFGLGMAEAMALGTPVIGTDHSGNRDFLSERSGFPVPCSIVPVGPGEYPEGEGQVWAEPDEAAAVAAMRRVVDDRAAARARADFARGFVAEHFGHAAVGSIAAARLRRIAGVIRKARMF